MKENKSVTTKEFYSAISKLATKVELEKFATKEELKREMQSLREEQARLFGLCVLKSDFEPWQKKVDADLAELKANMADALIMLRQMLDMLLPIAARHERQITHINNHLEIDWV